MQQSGSLQLYTYLIYETPVPVRMLVQLQQTTQSLQSAKNAPLRIGTTSQLALSEALFLQNQHACVIQMPEFMREQTLQSIIDEEKANSTLSVLPLCFFGATKILLEEFQKRPEVFKGEDLDKIFELRHQIRLERKKKIENGQLANTTLDELQGRAWTQME